MNKKAFTLVELLVTIIIIVLIALMGFPSLQRMLNDNTTKEIETYGKSMIGAAKMYMQKEGRDISEDNSATASLEGEGYIIKLNTLISENYIEEFKPSKNIKCNTETAEVRVKKDAKNIKNRIIYFINNCIYRINNIFISNNEKFNNKRRTSRI